MNDSTYINHWDKPHMNVNMYMSRVMPASLFDRVIEKERSDMEKIDVEPDLAALSTM